MGPILTGKIAKIIIYDKGQVNGGTNYDSSEPGWVPKLVIHNILTFVFHSCMGPTVVLTEIYIYKSLVIVALEIW